MANYDVGDQVRLSAAFSIEGQAQDPTEVTLKVKDKDGVVTTYTGEQVSHDETGKYHVDITLNKSGTWYYRWEGTGAVVAAGEAHLTAQPSVFGDPA